MTRDQLITIVLTRCGQRQNDEKLRTASVLELELLQTDTLEKDTFKPWFLLTENSSAFVEIDEERVPFPPSFLAEYEEGNFWIRRDTTEEWQLLSKDDYDVLAARHPEPGRPQAYSVVGPYFMLHPRPDFHYQVRIRYYKAQPTLTVPFGDAAGLQENAWTRYAPNWLIGELGRTIAGSYTRDPEVKAEFEGLSLRSRAQLQIDDTARREANRMRQMGDD